jgi:hypothetical protein
MKCKEIFREVKKVTTDDTKFFVTGSVTEFTQRTSYAKRSRYAVFVEWDDRFGDSEGITADELCKDGATMADAIRRCIDLIDLAAYRLSRPLAEGVKVADSTDDDEDICF